MESTHSHHESCAGLPLAEVGFQGICHAAELILHFCFVFLLLSMLFQGRGGTFNFIFPLETLPFVDIVVEHEPEVGSDNIDHLLDARGQQPD